MLRVVVVVVVCGLLNVPTKCLCVSGTDLLRQLYMLTVHGDRSCGSNHQAYEAVTIQVLAVTCRAPTKKM